jgi:hypothetical protein
MEVAVWFGRIAGMDMVVTSRRQILIDEVPDEVTAIHAGGLGGIIHTATP